MVSSTRSWILLGLVAGVASLASAASYGSYVNSNGRSAWDIDGGIELNENGQVYTFRSKARTANQKETVTINGQPAQVEYSNGDIVVELADHTVVAKVGKLTFLGDRNSFLETQENLRKMREDYARTFSQFPFA